MGIYSVSSLKKSKIVSCVEAEILRAAAKGVGESRQKRAPLCAKARSLDFLQ